MSYFSNQNQPIKTDEIFLSLRKRILKLELEPGQKISENKISEEYGVSRSVIRTVFTRLQQLRLIDVYPQRGTYISMIDLNYIRDILFLRTAVEKEVLSEIFEEVHAEEFAALVHALEQNLEEQEKLKDLEYYASPFKKLDSQFHKTMIDSVKRFGIVDLLSDQMVHLARWRNFGVAFDRRIPELIREHRAIVDAIREENLPKAHKGMADHLETIAEINDRAQAKYPQYFV